MRVIRKYDNEFKRETIKLVILKRNWFVIL